MPAQVPTISIGLVDPGSLGQPANTDQVPIYAGVAPQGTTYAVQTFGNVPDAEAEFGECHLVDVIAAAFADGADSVMAARLPLSTAGDDDWEPDTDGDELAIDSVSGTPYQFLRVRIECIDGDGATAVSAGTLSFRYSLDAWDIPFVNPTWSAATVVPASGALVLGNTGLTVNLDTAQTPAALDDTTFDTIPGHYSATEVAAFRDYLKSPLAAGWSYVCYTGDAQTASAANTIAQAIDAQNAQLFAAAYFGSALFGTGLEDDTDVITAFASTAADPPFLSAGFGYGYKTNPRSQVGRGRIALREHEVASLRIANSLVSTDPGRTASGALSKIVGLSYDAALQGSALHNARISALRTWEPASKGVYIQRQRLLSDVASNFTTWQHAAVMVQALRAAHRVAFQLVLETLRRKSTGTLDDRDAVDIEEATQAEIVRTLGPSATAGPLNVRGTPGHISAVGVSVSRIVLLPAVRVTIKIRPLGWAEDLTFTLEYADEVA
jgi:hypothetical protein